MGPRFLPDGDLLFTGLDKRLLRIAPDGSERSRVGGDGYAPYNAIARDVPTRVFALERDDGTEIWHADLDGRTAVQITHAGAATKPDISPDGKWVVYVTAHDGALWRVPSTGGTPVRLSPGIASNPAVSPDGTWVAMLFRETPGSPWIPAVVRMHRPGSVRKLALPPNTALWDIRFSRDGTAIDVAINDNEAGNIWRWPLDGSAPTQLTHFASEELRSFDWSWDGKLLACVRGGWRGDVVLLRGAW
jgi:WD40-like Beta Propeller Repeat